MMNTKQSEKNTSTSTVQQRRSWGADKCEMQSNANAIQKTTHKQKPNALSEW